MHWARDASEARRLILAILQDAGAKTVTKGKSMVTEEIALNPFLEANGIVPVETDLGEYIIQLRHEPPSHIIAPAFHLTKEQVADTFREAHTELDPNRSRVLWRAQRAGAGGARHAAPPVRSRRRRHHRRQFPERRRKAPRSSSPTRAMAT